jgi:hypothetical protein
MGDQKRRGSLFRLEKEGLIAKDVSHTLAALGWQDQRHDTAGRSQIFDQTRYLADSPGVAPIRPG